MTVDLIELLTVMCLHDIGVEQRHTERLAEADQAVRSSRADRYDNALAETIT